MLSLEYIFDKKTSRQTKRGNMAKIYLQWCHSHGHLSAPPPSSCWGPCGILCAVYVHASMHLIKYILGTLKKQIIYHRMLSAVICWRGLLFHPQQPLPREEDLISVFWTNLQMITYTYTNNYIFACLLTQTIPPLNTGVGTCLLGEGNTGYK